MPHYRQALDMILDMEPGGFPGVCIVTVHIQCKCVSITFCSLNYKLIFVPSKYFSNNTPMPCCAWQIWGYRQHLLYSFDLEDYPIKLRKILERYTCSLSKDYKSFKIIKTTNCQLLKRVEWDCKADCKWTGSPSYLKANQRGSLPCLLSSFCSQFSILLCSLISEHLE